MDHPNATQFSDDDEDGNDNFLVAPQVPDRRVSTHRITVDDHTPSGTTQSSSQRRPPLAVTVSPQHPLAGATGGDFLNDSSLPQARRLSSSQRVRSGTSLGGSGYFTPQSLQPPAGGGGGAEVATRVSATHDEYMYTTVKPTPYHSAFCGCGLTVQCCGASDPRTPNGTSRSQRSTSPHRTAFTESCCCCCDAVTYRTDSRWWQGCLETMFCFPCVVASQRRFLLSGPPNPVSSPLTPPPIPKHIRRLNASLQGGRPLPHVAAAGTKPSASVLGDAPLVKSASSPTFEDDDQQVALQEFHQSCCSRCCYGDCVLATVLPCVAVAYAVENRFLMEKYHRISDDNTPVTNSSGNGAAGFGELGNRSGRLTDLLPEATNSNVRSPRVASRNGSLVSAATPTPQLRMYQRAPTSVENSFSCATCMFPCCSAAQVGRELEMRGVGDQVRLRAPVTATMGICTDNGAKPSAVPTPLSAGVQSQQATSGGNQLPGTTNAGSPSTANGASPGYSAVAAPHNSTTQQPPPPQQASQQQQQQRGVYHLLSDHNNNSMSQSFRTHQAQATVGKGEEFAWVPFYPEVATREMMQRISREFWLHAPPPSMNISRNELMVNSMRGGAGGAASPSARRQHLIAPTARSLHHGSSSNIGAVEDVVPVVQSPTTTPMEPAENPLHVGGGHHLRRSARDDDEVDEELVRQMFPDSGAVTCDPSVGFYPMNHVDLLIGR